MPALPLPAVSLVATPGRRRASLELAREIEARGFAGIYVPSLFGNMAQCVGLALATERIPIGTAITPIYTRTVEDFATACAYLHEVSGGRFRFGIGVAHAPSPPRMAGIPGRPLADMRDFVERFKAQAAAGALPPIVCATLRRRMIALAGEIAQGIVFANASLAHMPISLAALPAERRDDRDFLIAAMIPCCIADDPLAARERLRRGLVRYARLPNYRAYWKAAGYGEEMAAVERALTERRDDDVPTYLTDRWLDDTTLYGTRSQVRDGLARWREAGIATPILVPSSIAGNQMTAFAELFAAFAD
jgi:alkanesulfonate monooxygenase SsuD/methylene tetrahydromethanopterin reductase-like flavin-dependent oxidoreductase (luciferase family)